MKLYLSGPMTGYPEHNFPAFHRATDGLRSRGFDVFNPAEHAEAGGYDATGKTGNEKDYDRRAALAADLEWICLHADGVAVLEGWGLSSGARAEVAAAQALGLPVRRVDEWTTGSTT